MVECTTQEIQDYLNLVIRTACLDPDNTEVYFCVGRFRYSGELSLGKVSAKGETTWRSVFQWRNKAERDAMVDVLFASPYSFGFSE